MIPINEQKLHEMLLRGVVLDSDAENIKNVCELVYNTYFNFRYNDDRLRSDLYQEGTLSVIRVSDLGNFDPNLGTALSFVYKAILNGMSNYLRKEDKIKLSDNSEEVISDKAYYSHISEDVLDTVISYILNQISDLELSEDISSFIKIYFYDKLGLPHNFKGVVDFSADFASKYRYYVNLIEWNVFKKFSNSTVFTNKISDILDVLEADNEIDFFTKKFLASLNKDQLAMMMYIFAGNTVTFPMKYQLLKIDEYLSIYKKVELSGMSVTEASKVFEKQPIVILGVVEKYGNIFS